MTHYEQPSLQACAACDVLLVLFFCFCPWPQRPRTRDGGQSSLQACATGDALFLRIRQLRLGSEMQHTVCVSEKPMGVGRLERGASHARCLRILMELSRTVAVEPFQSVVENHRSRVSNSKHALQSWNTCVPVWGVWPLEVHTDVFSFSFRFVVPFCSTVL